MQWKNARFPEDFGKNSRLVLATRGSIFIFFNGTVFYFFDPTAPDDAAWTQIKLTTFLFGATVMLATESKIFVARPGLSMASFNATTAELLPNPIAPPGIAVNSNLAAKFVMNNVLYFATATNLLVYSPEKNSWDGTIFPEVGAIGAVPFQGNVIAYKTDRLFYLNVDFFSWDVQDVDLPVNGSAVTVVADKYIIIVGGYGADGKATSAVHVLESKNSPTAPVTSTPDSEVTSAAPVAASIGGLLFSSTMWLLYL